MGSDRVHPLERTSSALTDDGLNATHPVEFSGAALVEDKLRWAPIVFYDEYDYGPLANCFPTTRDCYCCYTAPPCGWTNCCTTCCCCCLWSPESTFDETPKIAHRLGYFDDDGNAPLISYKWWQKEDGTGLHAVEVFRNPYAVDLYHSKIPFSLDCCTIMELLTLPCRQKFIETEVVYGDPSEIAKVGSFIEESKSSENSRCQSAESKGKLHKWTDVCGTAAPTKAQILEILNKNHPGHGEFHYGWGHKPSLTAAEKAE